MNWNQELNDAVTRSKKERAGLIMLHAFAADAIGLLDEWNARLSESDRDLLREFYSEPEAWLEFAAKLNAGKNGDELD